jgi:hypothetical protein
MMPPVARVTNRPARYLTTNPRGRADVAALVLSGAVAVVALLGITPDSAEKPERPDARPTRLAASNARACSLGPAESKRAVDTFHDKLMPVLMHPRCFNCHGGVDPTTETEIGGHIGGAVNVTTKMGACADCHEFKGWFLPPEELRWVGKSERELCMLFKQMERNPARFVEHVTNDHFPKAPEFQIAKVAFKGDASLNTLGEITYEEKTGQKFQPDPPRVSHAQFILDSRDWAYTIGDGFGVMPDCGCKLSGPAWEGTVKASWTMRTPELGLLTEKSTSQVRLDLDTTMIHAGNPRRYWKSTSGVIQWSIKMSGGECTSSASGSVPVGIGGDLNPMAIVQMNPRPDGTTDYQVGIGPWPDGYNPRFNWKCTSEPRVRPGIAYQVFAWWNVPGFAKLSPDGKTMKGTSTLPLGASDATFEWELHLVK